MFGLPLNKSINMILLFFTFSLSNIPFCEAYIFPLYEDSAIIYLKTKYLPYHITTQS